MSMPKLYTKDRYTRPAARTHEGKLLYGTLFFVSFLEHYFFLEHLHMAEIVLP